MRSLRHLLAGVILAGFGIALAFAAVEGGVRLLHLFPDRFWKPDPLLGTRLIPGFDGWWTQEELEFRTHAHINSQGFRDVEHALAKPDGVVRVLVLGDSFIEALQVPLDAMFGRQLEAQLNAQAPAGRRYEVVSMGVSGYGTTAELLMYREFGRRYDPDVVLLAFYPGNDVKNNSPDLEDRFPPVYSSGGSLERIVTKTVAEKPRGRLSQLINASQGYRFIRKKILTQHPDLATRLIRWHLLDGRAAIDVPKRDGVPLDYWVFAQTAPPDWQDAWRRTEELLAALAREVSADGAKLGVMIVTSREWIYPDTWEMIMAANPPMKQMKWDLEGPQRKILQWCQEHSISCLPLSRAFTANRNEGPRLHWVYDGHWTAAGHHLAAETVAGFLREQHLVPTN